MSDDMDVFLDTSDNCYIESLARSVAVLAKLPDGPRVRDLINKLEEVLLLELDLAVMGAEKARSEILKKNAKDGTVRPIR